MNIDNNSYTLKSNNTISTKALKKHTQNSCYLKIKSKKAYLYELPLDQYTQIFLEFIENKQEEKRQVLKAIPYFSFFDDESLKVLADDCVKEKYLEKQYIINQGDSPTSMYYIIKGKVVCEQNGKTVRILNEKIFFGELFYFGQDKSRYGYYAKESSEIYKINFQILNKILKEDNGSKKLIKSVFEQVIKNSTLLGKYYSHTYYMNYLYKSFQPKYYINQTIATLKNRKLFIIVAGFASKQTNSGSGSKKNLLNEQLYPRCTLCGEELLEEPYSSSNPENHFITIKGEECLVLEVDWIEILKSLYISESINRTLSTASSTSLSLSQIKQKSMYEMIQYLKEIPYLCCMSQIKLFELADNFKTVSYKENEIIIRDGPVSDKLFIIIQGKVSLIINKVEVQVLESPSSFGDISATSEPYEQTASYFAKTSVTCLCLDKEVFIDIIDNETMTKSRKMCTFHDVTITLDQLDFVKELGKGAYGKVYLVKGQKNLYALKEANIEELSKHKESMEYYKNEKKIMSLLNHPFIVGFINTFKTKQFLFFLLEYIDGISVREYIKTAQYKGRNIDLIKFTAAILCNVVNFFQRKKIIHRDLKPENLMINSKGYIKIVDFGVAKDLTNKDSTNTFLGTLNYMAPEMLMGKNYSFGIDVWSVGVILYELFYGKLPYGFGMTDPNDVLNDIKESNLVLPSDVKNQSINELIKKLLDKKPSSRMNHFIKWKNLDLFNGFNFSSLLNYEMKSPIEIDGILSRMNSIKPICPFHQFIKNNIFLSSKNLDDILLNSKANECFVDF